MCCFFLPFFHVPPRQPSRRHHCNGTDRVLQVQPEGQSDGSVIYSASNPDEGALLYAASHSGHKFIRRDGKDVVVAITTQHPDQQTTTTTSSTASKSAGIGQEGGGGGSEGDAIRAGGFRGEASSASGVASPSSEVLGKIEEEREEEVEFEILHTFAFTSDRKRSSVVVRGTGRKRNVGNEGRGEQREQSDGRRVVLYCKGADNVILERLDPKKNPPELVEKIRENVADFTRDGERGVCTYRGVAWS